MISLTLLTLYFYVTAFFLIQLVNITFTPSLTKVNILL